MSEDLNPHEPGRVKPRRKPGTPHKTNATACSLCKGSGDDPKARAHRHTSGGHDEAPPCPRCHGEGEEPTDALDRAAAFAPKCHCGAAYGNCPHTAPLDGRER